MNNNWINSVFRYLEIVMPLRHTDWLQDMRREALHISSTWSRFFFIMGCVRACLAAGLRDHVGVRRVGQILIAVPILVLCAGGAVIGSSHLPSDIVTPVYILLLVYAMAGCLVLVDLSWMKRYVAIAAVMFGLGCALMNWSKILPQQDYLQALFLEASILMLALYVAASFVDWSGDEPAV